jgi:amino acid permease
MRKKTFNRCILFSLLFLFLFLFSNAKAAKRVELIGRETLNFTLPSTHDRLINYAEEYYGKHHLIITFFPAAYTPV